MFSLIVATVNRVVELERLLVSLEAQTSQDFEVIVVDQNTDDRVACQVSRYPALKIRHLRSDRGVGRARNAGLRAATGSIIAFPDDDCWYPPTLLAAVAEWMTANPGLEGLFTAMRDVDNQPVGPHSPTSPRAVTKANLWTTTICVTAFLRRRVTDAVGFFQEDIGVGASTPYQSGEESDYFLRALALGFAMRYEPSLTVHHPHLHSLERLRRTAYSYSLGCGYVLRLHGYSWIEFGGFLVRSLGGALVSLAKANPGMAGYYITRATGQCRGYFWGARDLARFRARAD
jgi:glycosyltransferase involved in cell wall biosynthesis